MFERSLKSKDNGKTKSTQILYHDIGLMRLSRQ